MIHGIFTRFKNQERSNLFPEGSWLAGRQSALQKKGPTFPAENNVFFTLALPYN
jgi:hypothetical protein